MEPNHRDRGSHGGVEAVCTSGDYVLMYHGDENFEVARGGTRSQRFGQQGFGCRGRPGSCRVEGFGVQGIRVEVAPNLHERI